MIASSPTLLHTTPRTRTVLMEQIRAVALVLRIPAILAIIGIAFTTALNVWDYVNGHGGIEFSPQLSMLPGVVGALLPTGIWKREERIGGGFFWALPVDRRRHALIKVCAGWICLMLVVGFFMLWLLVFAAITNGNILAPQELLVLPTTFTPNTSLTASDLRTVIWTPMPALWLTPFTAATVSYLLASALALGSRYPLRWLIGLFLGALLISVTGSVAHSSWLKLAPSQTLETLVNGQYGLDALLTAKTESLQTSVTLVGGKSVVVWRALPDLKEWIVATALWWTIAVVALWAAASRHRERRSSTPLNSADS